MKIFPAIDLSNSVLGKVVVKTGFLLEQSLPNSTGCPNSAPRKHRRRFPPEASLGRTWPDRATCLLGMPAHGSTQRQGHIRLAETDRSTAPKSASHYHRLAKGLSVALELQRLRRLSPTQVHRLLQ